MRLGIVWALDHVGGDSDKPLRALLEIGGITLLQRHLRMLKRAGVERAIVIGPGDNAELNRLIDNPTKREVSAKLIYPGEAEKLDANESDMFLFHDAGTLVDERTSRLLIENDKPGIAIISRQDVAEEDRSIGSPFGEGLFAGAALFTTPMVKQLIQSARSEELANNLKLLIIDQGVTLLDLSAENSYVYGLRRCEPFVWMPIISATDESRAKWRLLDRSQAGCLDWPAWYIHRPIEKKIVYHICETEITPNQITILCIIVAFCGTAMFAAGHLVSGLLIAMAVGIIDGLDGKLARMKLMTSRLGEFEELSDKIYEASWYIAMAYYFSPLFPAWSWLLAAIYIGSNGLELIAYHVFKTIRGVQLDDFAPFDRMFRLIAARRNINMYLLLSFYIADQFVPSAGFSGFAIMVAWGVTGFLVHTFRTAYLLTVGSTKRVV